MVVQRNPNYWGKPALLNQIVFRFIPDTNTQFQAMRGGEVNIIHPQPQPQIAEREEAERDHRAAGRPVLGSTWTCRPAPAATPPLKRKFVREAIVTAVNRQQTRQVIYKDTVSNLPAPNNAIYKNFQSEYESHKFQPFGFSQSGGHPFFAPTAAPAARRPRRPEQRLLLCPGVGKLSFDFYSTAGNQQRELAFQIMQVQLRSVGIQLNSKFSLTALTVTLPTKKWDIMLFAWVGTPDPASSVNIFRCGGAQNYNGTAAGPRRASCSRATRVRPGEAHGAPQQGDD